MKTNRDNVMSLENFFQTRNETAHKEAALNMAWMNTKLCVPLIMQDIMSNDVSVDEETVFGLHDMISDFEIDTALLAIAAGALQIVRSETIASPSLHVLAIECERIICEYGDAWVNQNKAGEPDFDYVLSILAQIPEDFEALTDLIDSAIGSIDETSKTAILLDILSVQAGAQMLVAEEFVSVMNADTIIEEKIEAPIIAAGETTDNVIAFRAK